MLTHDFVIVASLKTCHSEGPMFWSFHKSDFNTVSDPKSKFNLGFPMKLNVISKGLRFSHWLSEMLGIITPSVECEKTSDQKRSPPTASSAIEALQFPQVWPNRLTNLPDVLMLQLILDKLRCFFDKSEPDQSRAW